MTAMEAYIVLVEKAIDALEATDQTQIVTSIHGVLRSLSEQLRIVKRAGTIIVGSEFVERAIDLANQQMPVNSLEYDWQRHHVIVAILRNLQGAMDQVDALPDSMRRAMVHGVTIQIQTPNVGPFSRN